MSGENIYEQAMQRCNSQSSWEERAKQWVVLVLHLARIAFMAVGVQLDTHKAPMRRGPMHPGSRVSPSTAR